jgi:rhamnulose-1-phosphate aldolase
MTERTLDDLIDEMGDAGTRMSEIDAAEGAAGNISVFQRRLEPDTRFEWRDMIELPVETPHLAGGWVVVTAAGRRLRDIAHAPERALCLLNIADDGQQAELYAAPDMRPTSELNTHLAVHNDHVGRRDLAFHAVLHAQPIHLAFLSHIERYQDHEYFNRRILRWQPETIVEFPEGIGMLPFEIPGTLDQTALTTPALARYRGIVWASHGIVTRSDASVWKASDLVEYAEAAARYEYLNLAAGEPTGGISEEAMRAICERMGIQQAYF